MGLWAAVFWGAFSSSALYLGQVLAGPMGRRPRLTGLVSGFGAGTLLAAVAYELVPQAILQAGVDTALGFVSGAVVYFVCDWLIDRGGGKNRQRIAPAAQSGSGVAMFLGALLDGIPEAFILGISLAAGGGISVAFVAAVFVSNVPQGIAGTTSMLAAGYTGRRVFRMWTGLTIACAVLAGLGFALADSVPDGGYFASAFAAGAVLTMLSDSMMPEAFRTGGSAVGLATVLGYLVAAMLTFVG
ncbi:ZIP family zinc transporter [Hamadaea sp. NPDC050747]|uniref:ZIP family metal transporter n=1 Tax=Hamadaea sp. NPDC050747 TaxID=3155789 RepID=UPI0033EDB175